jgi:receptor-type tyrosine-protein phosphatase gamma
MGLQTSFVVTSYLFLLICLIVCLNTVPDGKPTITTAQNTSATSLHISWRPPHRDTIHGEFLGYRIEYRPRDRGPEAVKEIYIRDSNVGVSINMNMRVRTVITSGPRTGTDPNRFISHVVENFSYRICSCTSRTFFDKNLASKIYVRLIHGILCHFDDWAHDAGIVCC